VPPRALAAADTTPAPEASAPLHRYRPSSRGGRPVPSQEIERTGPPAAADEPAETPAPAKRPPRKTGSGSRKSAPPRDVSRETSQDQDSGGGKAEPTPVTVVPQQNKRGWFDRGADKLASTATDNGAGFIMGIILWSWVLLPFLQGGAQQVKDTLRAKFLNKDPNGGWLP